MKKIISVVFILLIVGLTFTTCSNSGSKNKTEQLAKDETYTCKMHQDVMSDIPGKCPVCGMDLEKQIMTGAQKKLWKEGTYVKTEK